MKTIKTQKYPSLYYTNENSAKQDAEKHNFSVCRIIFVSEWNGEIEETFLGYGLINDGKLLGSKDPIYV